MRKILVVLCVVIFCGTAYAAKYPEMGICTGAKVRLRESPSSKGKIIGLVKPDRNRFVVLGEVRSGGQKWYKIDHPTKKGTAYVAADYVEITPVGNVFAEVRLTFGVYPEKTRAIFGRPSWKIQQGWNGSQALEIKDSYAFNYNEDGIWSAVIFYYGEKAIAGIRTGDKPEKLLALGMPASELDMEYGEEDDDLLEGSWEMTNEDTGEKITFMFSGKSKEDSKIDYLEFHRPTKQAYR